MLARRSAGPEGVLGVSSASEGRGLHELMLMETVDGKFDGTFSGAFDEEFDGRIRWQHSLEHLMEHSMATFDSMPRSIHREC